MSEMRSFAGTQMVLSPRFSRIIPSLYLKFFIILPYINKTMDYAMVSRYICQVESFALIKFQVVYTLLIVYYKELLL